MARGSRQHWLPTEDGGPGTVRRASLCCTLVWLMLTAEHRLVRGWVECIGIEGRVGRRAGSVGSSVSEEMDPEPEVRGGGGSGMTMLVEVLNSSQG